MRRRNVTRPPDAVALVVIGVVGCFVGLNAIAVLVAVIHLIRWAVGAPVWDDGDAFQELATALAGATSLVLALVGALGLRRITAVWARAQDPEPPEESAARWGRDR